MFRQPEWFFLLPVLAFLGWYARGLQLWRPLRVICLLLATIFLADPQWRLLKPGLDLWVLVDQSDSAKDVLGPRLTEWEALISDSRGPDDTLHFVDFARGATERSSDILRFEDSLNQTNLATALHIAEARRANNRAARVLILTDGYSTEPLANIAKSLQNAKTPVDYRLAIFDATADFQVERLDMPNRNQTAEPFLIELLVTGPAGGSTEYHIKRDDKTVAQGTVSTPAGRGRIRLKDRILTPGAYRYEATLSNVNDPRPGNNSAERWIEISGGPRIILVTRYQDDPVATTLRRLGFELEVITNARQFHEGRLTGAQAVIFNDIPANEIPADTLEAIDFYVRGQGGGFVMLGGKFSFGSGGYFESPVENILPVSLELKEEHRKLAVAMAIVVDRSGSMATTVPGGMSKMDLANSGVAEAARLLGPNDLLTVFAVDSEPHIIVPLTSVGPNLPTIENRVRSIQSMGGGIYVYTGLKAAWQELKKSPVGQKHIILFSDAADSEEPGNYKSLIAEMVKEGASVSVIGLGSSTDSDAAFIEDIAKLGNGRMFFNDNPANLPAVFAQETVAVARSAFVEEQTGVEPTAGWLQIAAGALDWPAYFDGYNLSYLKEGATAAANTRDEYNAPLVAFWNRGSGRAAAVSFAVSGDYSAATRTWPAYGDFMQTLTRWLIGQDIPRGLGLSTHLQGNELTLDFFYDDTQADLPEAGLPKLLYTTQSANEALTGVWERIEPGLFRAKLTLDFGQSYRGAVQVGDHSLPFGPIIAGENVEWQTSPVALNDLIQLSKTTGGEERVNLAESWQAPDTDIKQSLRLWILFLLTPLFLLEILQTRLGLASSSFQDFFSRKQRI
ncbi:vWA domain-containing protein [Cerasicoccus arenae]|uniref:VWA domain-containing protein n=1 Tax=Cerasicoccus arenae TaxID=424488 RepID=A0A8J3DEX5_9BACT|nr:VWA domain-containing protein [Cerasicoccus arenae]MBK1859577.1 VWA domain-containing protein [Cerasicoccus arenae]GHB92840.1 VWA domain-containing protein [Cerasicoccus arenae]